MSDPQVPGYPDHGRPKAPVESKVKWATLGTYLAGVVAMAVVNAFTGNDNELLIDVLPDAIEPFILPVVPAVVSFVSGYFAKHSPRPDGL